MAHNLNINKNTGKASFFSAKEPAWHGLGQILNGPATSEEAIKEAGLDFTVAKEPVYVGVRKIHKDESLGLVNVLKDEEEVDKDNKKVIYKEAKSVPDRYATYRTDNGTPFGIVGSRYEIVQNTQAFDFFDAIVGKGEAIYETAGALHDGQIVFITAKLPDYIRVAGDDVVKKYLLLNMAHDGSGSINAMFTPIRVVCNNTLNAALRQAHSKISIRHTRSAHDNLKEAHKIMGITNTLSKQLEEIFSVMSKVRITDKQLVQYIEKVVLGETIDSMVAANPEYEISTRSKNIITDIQKYAEVGVGQQMEHTKGTAYGAYNAITGYYQNVKSYRSQEAKMESNLLGDNYVKMQKAMNMAWDFKNN